MNHKFSGILIEASTHVGAIPCGCPEAVKYLFICASVLNS